MNSTWHGDGHRMTNSMAAGAQTQISFSSSVRLCDLPLPGNQYKAVNAAVGTFLLVSTGTWSLRKRQLNACRASWPCGLSTIN